LPARQERVSLQTKATLGSCDSGSQGLLATKGGALSESADYEGGELSEPRVLGPESPEGELSAPVGLASAPREIAAPEYGKPTHLAKSRFRIALCSIVILAFIVVAAFVTLWTGRSIDGLTRLLEIIFAPVVAIVASAVAFYYRDNTP
jgi:hypothetical protein